MIFTEKKAVHEALWKSLTSDLNGSALASILPDNTAFKSILSNTCKLIPKICGDDVDMRFVIEKVEAYCKYPVDEKYNRDTELALFQSLLAELYKYEELLEKQNADVDNAIDMVFKNLDKHNLSDDNKLADVKFFATRQNVYNSSFYTLNIAYGFESFIAGVLDAPSEEDEIIYGMGSNESAGYFTVAAMPSFVHLPIAEDISDEAIEKFPMLSTLRKVAKYSYVDILSMIHDNDDGTAFVKLFKKNANGEYAPVFAKISKYHAYANWNLLSMDECFYVGLIREAMNVVGIDLNITDESEVLATLFGPEYKLSENDEIKNDEYYKTHFSSETINEYLLIGADLFNALVYSTSLFEGEIKQRENLIFAIRLYLFILPSMVNFEKKTFAPVMDVLKNASDEFKSCIKDINNIVDSMRQSLCDLIDVVYNAFQDEVLWTKPCAVIRAKFRERFAKRFLVITGKSEKDADIKQIADGFESDKKFGQITNSLSILDMNAIVDKEIEILIAAYIKLLNKN